MYENEKRAILDACLKMKEYHLISLTGGNVSMAVDENRYLMKRKRAKKFMACCMKR